ncbi:MAG: inositol monophosphatase family protein [Candidatus Altiarchaeota archaeon]
MAIDNETLLELGESIVDSITSQIRSLSEEGPIGSRIKRRKLYEVFVEDDVSAGSTKSIAEDFVDSSDIKNLLVTDAWHVVEDFSAEKIKKLVLIGLTVGVKVFGDKKSKEGVFVILDSIDGSNNLRDWVTPAPYISTAVAIGSLGNLKARPGLDAVDVAVVSEVFHEDKYYAMRGEGAFFKGWGKIASSPKDKVDGSILGVDTDLTGDDFKFIEGQVCPLMGKIKCCRRLGSSVLDFCKVACGEYDVFLSLGGRMILSDVAPSKLIVEEAGGIFAEQVVSEGKSADDILRRIILDGDHNLISETKFNIVASGNKKIHDAVLKELKS